VVVLGYLRFLKLDSTGFDPRTLRVFRVFRPIRAITSIQGVRAIIGVLSTSLSLLLYVGLVYLFYLAVFAIAGFQLWQDSLNVRCMNEETNEFNQTLLCGYYKCPQGYVCSSYHESLNGDIINFDNFFSSLLMAFIVSTDEGRLKIEGATIRVHGYYATLYFTLLVLIGTHFLRHFVLGIFQYNVALLQNNIHQSIEYRDIRTINTLTYKCKTLRIPKRFQDESELEWKSK
jgi:hypothetical protein